MSDLVATHPDELTGAQHYAILYDLVHRVARFPPDFDAAPLIAATRAMKLAVDQNDILRRDLAEQATIIASLQRQISEMRGKL